MPHLSTSLLVAVVSAVFYVVAKVYNARKFMYHLRKLGLPMPPLNPITGHMLIVKAAMTELPPDAMIHHTITKLASETMKSEAFYLDFWPISNPVLVVISPDMASQLAQPSYLEKPDVLKNALASITDGPSLLGMSEPTWKQWRPIFNPGFSASSILQQTPNIVRECRGFCKRLGSHARNSQMFCLEKDTMKLTLDVISVVTLDTHFPNSSIPDSFRDLILWTSLGTEFNPFKRWNPLRPFKIWYNGRKINSYIVAELEKRFLERQASSSSEHNAEKAKSIITLALDAYMEESKLPNMPHGTESLDETFKRYACAQIRTFLFAGHDTTAATMTYIYHLLGQNHDCLARLRAEHDLVFGSGTDADSVGDLLSNNPALLNQLPYTTACIKETLRLYPPGGSMRVGASNTILVGKDGTRYPTAGCNVWNVHHAIHRNPDSWPSPNDFIPDRWLATEGEPLHPVKGAWRPFEFGPRNCIGQTLALAELKTILAMSIRQFDILPAYDEWDRLHPTIDRRINKIRGERAYQVQGGGGGGHAANGYPCRVRFTGVYSKE